MSVTQQYLQFIANTIWANVSHQTRRIVSVRGRRMCLCLLLKVSDSRFKVVVKAREQNSLNLHAFILNSSKRS